MNTQSWSQRQLVITLTERSAAHLPPVISATYKGQSTSSYSLAVVKDWLLEQGLEADEPVMDWLWSLQEQGHD